jgi:hypothetical protein
MPLAGCALRDPRRRFRPLKARGDLFQCSLEFRFKAKSISPSYPIKGPSRYGEVYLCAPSDELSALVGALDWEAELAPRPPQRVNSTARRLANRRSRGEADLPHSAEISIAGRASAGCASCVEKRWISGVALEAFWPPSPDGARFRGNVWESGTQNACRKTCEFPGLPKAHLSVDFRSVREKD